MRGRSLKPQKFNPQKGVLSERTDETRVLDQPGFF